jgi:hypothetical protein
MKKTYIILVLCVIQLSSCKKQTDVEDSISSTNKSIPYAPESQKQLGHLRQDIKFSKLERSMLKDSSFNQYVLLFDNVRMESFNYVGEKLDKKMIAQNKSNAKNIDQLAELYKKAGMKDARKRIINGTSLCLFHKKLCIKYPEFAKLSSSDKRVLITEASTFKVNGKFLKNFVKKNKKNT